MAVTYSRVLPRTQQQRVDRVQRDVGKALTIMLFLLPGLTIFMMFLIIPVAQTGRYSLHKWDGLQPLSDENYIGLDNYERLYNHGVFEKALRHSIVLTFLSVGVQLPLAMAVALTVGRGKLPGRKFFRVLFFVPYVFSEVITALIWMFVLHPKDGLMNTVTETLGLGRNAWLGDSDTALYAIFGVLTWKFLGLHMILYMAALQGVPKELEEAGRLDGATEFNLLRYITLPYIGPTIRLTIFLSVLGSLQQFVIVWVMTQGGPVNATELITTYLYKFGLTRLSLGYGSAVAVVLFCMTLLFSLGYQQTIMRQDYSDER